MQRAAAGRTEYIRLMAGDRPLRMRELLRLFADDADFADWYSDELAASPFAAYFWEHPPLTTATLDDGVEFVLVDAPSLARFRADPQPFRARFGSGDVVTFRNLGGDALLIAPCPALGGTDAAHLAVFLRTAPQDLRRALWQSVGRALRDSLSESPLWLSTSGLGVAWLHVRLDRAPKYYQHRPYADLPP